MKSKIKFRRGSPLCHFTEMELYMPSFWVKNPKKRWFCVHCGHTKKLGLVEHQRRQQLGHAMARLKKINPKLAAQLEAR